MDSWEHVYQLRGECAVANLVQSWAPTQSDDGNDVMTHASSPPLAVPTLVFCLGLVSWGGVGEADEKEPLSKSPAVACKAIDGYEDFEPLPDATLTSDEKLLVYYRPAGFQTEQVGDEFRAHFVQDAQIRRRGEKTVLKSKKKLLDYEFKSDSAPALVYLRNTISLKGMKPGKYELDIILHDKIGGGTPATQALPFEIVAAPPTPLVPSPDGSED